MMVAKDEVRTLCLCRKLDLHLQTGEQHIISKLLSHSLA